MTKPLHGRTALVLAASRGLGLGIARALAADGAAVFLTSRSEDRLKAAAEAIRAEGGTAEYAACDIGQAGALERLVAAARARFPNIDILVTNGGGPPMGTALEVEDAAWQAGFESLVMAPVRLCRALVPEMQARRWGRILMVASSSAIQPLPRMVLSNTLRGGLLIYAKTLADEVAADGVTVNVLVPGRIDTDRVRELDHARATREGKSDEAVREESMRTIPAKRYGTPAEFGGAAAYLCRDEAAYVTGSAMRIDGGLIRSIG